MKGELLLAYFHISQPVSQKNLHKLGSLALEEPTHRVMNKFVSLNYTAETRDSVHQRDTFPGQIPGIDGFPNRSCLLASLDSDLPERTQFAKIVRGQCL